MIKRVLLGTTSLIVASAVAVPAMAAEKIRLELGGKMEQYFGGVRTFDDGGRKAASGFGIDSDTEVYFTGSTTLDNGITIKARIELEAEANDTNRNADEQYVDISGQFGLFRIGERTGVFDTMAVRAPNGGYVSQQDIIDWMKPSNVRDALPGGLRNFVDLEPTLDNDTLRMSYITPQFYGFTVGASYAPNAAPYEKGFPRVREGRKNSNETQVSVSFDHKFDNGVGVKADGAFATPVGTDQWAYRGGLGLSYADFKLSGGYLGTQASGENRGPQGGANGSSTAGLNKGGYEIQIWEAGLAYDIGPGGVEFVYAESDAGKGSRMGDAVAYKLGGWYDLGPGVRAVANAFYAETDGKTGSSDDKRNGIGLISGLVLNF